MAEGQDARVQEIRAQHRGERISTEVNAPEYCPHCIVRWPCDYGRLLARLDAALKARDSWRSAATSNMQAFFAESGALRAERDALAAQLAERDAEIKALVEAGRGLADALSAFSVDVGALPEIRQYRLTHLDADPPRDYPVTLVQPWGDYRVVDDRLEDWYAALAARGGEGQG